MALGLVNMDLSKHRSSIGSTADVIRALYAALYQMTGNQQYNLASAANYAWDATTGYAGAIGDAIDALGNELGGGSGGSGGNPDTDISNVFSKAKAGSFTLAEDMTSGTYTINHGLGGAPDAILLFSQLPIDVGASDIEPTIAYAAYVKSSTSSTYRSITVRIRPGQAVSSAAGASAGPGFVANSVTTSSFGITCTAGGGLRGGTPYFWIAMKLKGGAG